MENNPRSEEVKIRPATLADAPQLAVLAGHLGYPATLEQVATRLRQILRAEQHVVYVAEAQNGLLAGFADLFVLRTVESDARLEVGGLVVHESWRSHGVGQKLMERAEEWARAQGCTEAGLRSNVIRERAHQFYERLGYRVNKTQKSFRKKLQ